MANVSLMELQLEMDNVLYQQLQQTITTVPTQETGSPYGFSPGCSQLAAGLGYAEVLG